MCLYETNTKCDLFPIGIHACNVGKKNLLTNANHFLNLDTGGIDLFGKLTDGLVGVLIGKGVNIYSHSWGTKFEKKGSKERRKFKKKVKVNLFRLLLSICSLFPSCCRLRCLPLWILSSSSSFLLSIPRFTHWLQRFSCHYGWLRWRWSSLTWNFCGTQITMLMTW